MNLDTKSSATSVSRLGRFKRPLIILFIFGTFFGLLAMPPPADLSQEGWNAFALFVATVLLWVTNQIPLAVTSLLAIAGIPLLGIMSEAEAYSYFGHKVVFFIMGAFILGAALVGSGLSTRLAMLVIERFGGTPKRLVISVYFVGAVGSCFISEHAVAAMLFPLAMSVARNLDMKEGGPDFAAILFQALAWGCIAGGTTTILGGGRGPLAIGILEEFSGGEVTIGFMEYVAFDIPLVFAMLVFGYVMLTRSKALENVSIEAAQNRLAAQLGDRGPLSRRELGVGVVMLVTIVLWVVKGEAWGLANIALCATGFLFVLNWMSWRDVEEGVNWAILIMYGGAICLGTALHQAGTTEWLTSSIRTADNLSPQLILLALGAMAVVLTELMSNSAVIAVLLPAALEIGAARGIDLRVVTMGIVLPSNFAFTFPMATPANALAYSSGFLNMKQMIRRGLLMDLAGYAAFVFLVMVYWPALGYSIGQ